MISNIYSIDPVSNEQAALDALNDIAKDREETRGLISRWSTLNRGVLKHFRFETIYTIAGASGAAKSALLNMLRTDFTDNEPIYLPCDELSPAVIRHLASKGEFYLSEDEAFLIRNPLNPDLPFKTLFLHFTIEMSPKRENLRTLSSLTGWDSAYLRSSSVIGYNGDNPIYNKISDDEYKACELILKAFAKRKNILPFKLSPNVEQLKRTAYKAAEMYPDHKLIIAIDHGLLLSKTDENSDTELLNNLIKALIEVRDVLGAMIIDLAQMNSNIEDDNRRKNLKLHYPTKKDLYCGGQLYQGSDYVFTMFAPKRIHLEEYGPDKMPTDRLIHLGLIKNRDGNEGDIWLKNYMNVGKLIAIKRTLSDDGLSMVLNELPSLINAV